MSAGWSLLSAVSKGHVPGFSPSFWHFADNIWCSFFCLCWLEQASPRSLPSSSLGVLPVCLGLCVQISPFYKDTVILNEFCPNHLILTWSSAKSLLSNKISFTSTWCYYLTSFCGGHSSTENSEKLVYMCVLLFKQWVSYNVKITSKILCKSQDL